MLSDQYNILLVWEPPTEEENQEFLAEVLTGSDHAAWCFVLLNARFVVTIIRQTLGMENIDDETFSDGLIAFHLALTRLKLDARLDDALSYSRNIFLDILSTILNEDNTI